MDGQLPGYRLPAVVGGAHRTTGVRRGRRVSDGLAVAIRIAESDASAVLRRQWTISAGVVHPHVLQPIDVVDAGSCCALVSLWADGGSLADMLERGGPLTAGQLVTVLAPITSAVAQAHEMGVIHGNLTPSEVFFNGEGRPLLAGLGARTALQEAGSQVGPDPTAVAPEVARGAEAGPAADVFGLGSIALSCLRGAPAWPATDLRDVVIQSTIGQWPDPGEGCVDPALTAVVRSLLDPDPERRPTAARVVVQLRSACRPEPVDLGLRRPVDRTDGADDLDAEAGGAPGGGPKARVGSGSGHNRVAARARHRAPAPQDVRARVVARLGPLIRGREGREGPGSVGRPGAGSGRGPVAAPRPGQSPGPGAGPGPGRWRRRAVALGLSLVLVLLAVQAGLWWAGWDARGAAVAARADQLPALGNSGAESALPGTSVPTATMSGPAPRAGLATGASRPDTTDVAPAAGTSAATPGRTGTTKTSISTTGIAGATTPVNVPASSWLRVVRALDAARGRAMVQRDIALLDAVYTASARPRSDDAAVITRLRTGGWTVSGAAHRILSATPVRAGPAGTTVRVTDSLPAYLVRDKAGRAVGRTSGRAARSMDVLLTRFGAGWLIADVSPVGIAATAPRTAGGD